MATETLVKTVANPSLVPLPTFAVMIWRGLRLALITSIGLGLGAAALEWVLRPALQSVNVEENFTATLSALLVGLLPVSFYIAGGMAARAGRKNGWMSALLAAWVVACMGYSLLTIYHLATGTGIFRQAPSLGFALRQTNAGVEVVSVDDGGPAEVAGLQPGDIITALRRDPVTEDDLQNRISLAALDDAFRLRIQRGAEELQVTTRIGLTNQTDVAAWVRNLVAALVIATVALVIPAHFLPHLLVILALLPLLAGYLWLVIATFSQRTHGLLPIDVNGNIGGWTLANWGFLTGASAAGSTVNILAVTLNSLIIALSMTVVSLVICSMSGYALSRMTFPGRRLFLSMTLVLHGFPAVTLIIPIFFILINLGNIPIIGQLIGYNSTGGIALVMIAFELPLGVWLMKGFFDNISWDMERSALIDGASRWRTFWEIILPQIRPGLLALGIFSFIGGWNAYLIPATYSVGTGLATLPVYIRQLSGELAPVNWNQVAAVGLFQLIPIFILFIFAQEYLLNIYAGGTKGSS